MGFDVVYVKKGILDLTDVMRPSVMEIKSSFFASSNMDGHTGIDALGQHGQLLATSTTSSVSTSS